MILSMSGPASKARQPPPNPSPSPPKAKNGCPRCPTGRATPCANERHQCRNCNGLSITATHEYCPHPDEGIPDNERRRAQFDLARGGGNAISTRSTRAQHPDKKTRRRSPKSPAQGSRTKAKG